MLKNLIIGASVSSLALLGLPVLVLAQENESIDQSEQVMQITQTNTIEQESSEVESRDDRIKKLKDKATEKVSDNKQRRIEARCSNAQKKLTNLSARLSDSLEKRRNAYLGVSARLSKLVQKLQAAGVNTDELEIATNEISTLINDSLTSSEIYVQSLADMTNMDCVAEPEGFQLLLDEARQKRVEIVSFQSEIQAIKNEKLKPVLVNIRESLSSETTNLESGE